MADSYLIILRSLIQCLWRQCLVTEQRLLLAEVNYIFLAGRLFLFFVTRSLISHIEFGLSSGHGDSEADCYLAAKSCKPSLLQFLPLDK